jgi:hypothetical protein
MEKLVLFIMTQKGLEVFRRAIEIERDLFESFQ